MILTNSLTVNDGGLGIAAPGQKPVAVVGCSSSGTADTPTPIDTLAGITSTFGYGPLAEAAAAILSIAGGIVICMKAATVTAAILGGMAQSGGGSSASGTFASVVGTGTAEPALTGTPDAPYAVRIKVTTAGANIAATPVVAVSLDGGVTYLPAGLVVVSATPQAIGTTGLLLAWNDGSFVLNDLYNSFGANCPTNADATGTAVPVMSGTPVDAFEVRIKVTTAAANLAANAATVKVSLDAGRSYSPDVSIPVSGVYAIPNTGLTVTFGDGTFVVDDIFRWATSAPAWSTTTLGNALTALSPQAGEYEFVHVAGAVDATSAATIKTWGQTRAAAGEYTFAVAGARDQITGESITTWAAALGATTPGFSGFDGEKYLDVQATHGYVASYLRPGVYFRRNLSVLRAARLAAIRPHEHPGKVKNGPIVGLMPDPDGSSSVLHPVSTYTSLDTYRFSGAQPVKGQPRGRYFFTSRTMATAVSDFGEVQRIRVINLAAGAALAQMSTYVGDNPELKTDGTGRIAEAEAQAIDGEVAAAVKTAVAKDPNRYASGVTVRTVRTNNLGSTGALQCSISVVPKGSINSVSTTISYALVA